MAENIVRKIKLPDGKVASIRMPSDWDKARVQQELIDREIISPSEPQRGPESGFLDSVGEVPGAIAKGFEKGVEETSRTIGDIREGIFNQFPALRTFDPFSNQEDKLTPALQNLDVPDMGKDPKSTLGNLAEVTTQFLTGTMASPIKGGGLVKAAVQAAFGDFLAFDPEETKTLSTALNKVPVLKSIVPDALVSDPDDTRWEGKVKNTIEGGAIGVTADAVIRSVRGLKDAVKARMVKEVPPEELPEALKSLPAPQKEFTVDSAGGVQRSQAPNTTRLEGQNRQLAERRASVGVSRQADDAAKAEEVIKSEREAAFDSIEAKERAIKNAQIDEAYKQNLDQVAENHINDLIRRSTKSPKFKQGGQVDPAVFREGIKKLYDSSKDLFEFTKKGKEQFGPHFEAGAEAMYRSIRAEKGEIQETPLPREREGGYNPAKFNTTEEIQQYTDELVRKHGRSKEVRKWDDVKRQAMELGMSRKQINRLRSESKNWTARIKAAHDVALDSWETTQKSAVKAVNGTPDDLMAFYEKMAEDAELLNSIIGIRSEAGRLLNSLKMMAESRGEVTEQFNKFLEGQGGEASLRSIAEKVAQAKPAEARRIMRRSIRESTLTDAVIEYWMNWGLLSGPQTHITNFLSTGANMALSVPETFLTSTIGKVTRSKDAQSFAQAGKYALGMKQSWYDAFRSMGKTLKSDDAIIVAGNREIQDNLGKLELEAHKAWSANTFSRYLPESAVKHVPKKTRERIVGLVDKSGSGIRTPGKGLFVGDAFWKTFGYRTKLNQLAQDETEKLIKSGKIKKDEAAQTYQNFVNNPTKEMHEGALSNARYRTWTKELGETGKAIQKMTSSQPALKFVAPFVRVVGNILKHSVERSPFGLLSKDIKAGGRARDEALAKVVLGTSVAGVAMEMAEGGVLTGGAPRDPESRANFYDSGRIPYSVKVGDKWRSIARIEPLGTIMGAGADLSQAWDYMSNGQRDKAVAHLGVAMGELVVNKTWMQSLHSLLQSVTEPEVYGTKWLEDTLGTLLVPNLLAQTARDVDPKIKVHIDRIEDILGVVDRRTPWKRSEVVNKLNRWGEPIEFNGNMANPFWESSPTDSKFLQNMYKHDIQVGMPSKKVAGVDLGPEMYNKYVKLSRVPARRMLEKRYDTTNISELSPEIQEKEIKKVLDIWDNYARKQMYLDPKFREAAIKKRIMDAEALTTPEKEDTSIEVR